jgi:hypothetical protein
MVSTVARRTLLELLDCTQYFDRTAGLIRLFYIPGLAGWYSPHSNGQVTAALA